MAPFKKLRSSSGARHRRKIWKTGRGTKISFSRKYKWTRPRYIVQKYQAKFVNFPIKICRTLAKKDPFLWSAYEASRATGIALKYWCKQDSHYWVPIRLNNMQELGVEGENADECQQVDVWICDSCQREYVFIMLRLCNNYALKMWIWFFTDITGTATNCLVAVAVRKGCHWKSVCNVGGVYFNIILLLLTQIWTCKGKCCFHAL